MPKFDMEDKADVHLHIPCTSAWYMTCNSVAGCSLAVFLQNVIAPYVTKLCNVKSSLKSWRFWFKK